MDTAVKMLDHFKRCGFSVSLDGDDLIIDHRGRMTDKLRDLILKVKPALVTHLKAMELVLNEPHHFQSLIEDYLERTAIFEWDAPDTYTNIIAADIAAKQDVIRAYTNFVKDEPIIPTYTAAKSDENRCTVTTDNPAEDW